MLCAFMSSRGFRFMPPALILFRVNIAFGEKDGAFDPPICSRGIVASCSLARARESYLAGGDPNRFHGGQSSGQVGVSQLREWRVGAIPHRGDVYRDQSRDEWEDRGSSYDGRCSNTRGE